MTEFVRWMNLVPNPLLYLLLGAGAATENIIPAVPADTFVALGGFLSAVGDLNARWVFVATWLCNVSSALVMYRLGYHRGKPFFEVGVGRHLLKPHQVERMGRFYDRWGTPAIFLTRFLPGLRSVVPVFAGVTRQGWLPVAAPIVLASAIWYGGLVALGAWAGHNLELLARLLGRVNAALGAVAVVLALVAFAWWWTTRRRPHE